MTSNVKVSHSIYGDVVYVTDVSFPIEEGEFVFSSKEPDGMKEWRVTILPLRNRISFLVQLHNQNVTLEKCTQKVEYGFLYPTGDRSEMKRINPSGTPGMFSFFTTGRKPLLLKVTTKRESIQYGKQFSEATNLKMYNDKEFSDVVVKCGGTRFECHKVVLASSSPVFKAMLTSNMKEKINNEIEIDDIKPEVMTELLEFIYTGRSSNLDNFSEDLLIAADKYGIDSLKKLCEGILINSLGIENCFSLLILGDTFSPTIKESALKFVIKNKERIKFEENLVDHPSLMADILRDVFC